MEGVEAAAREDEEHHAVVGKVRDGEEDERTHEPAGALESVGEAEDSGADDGDEDIGEGLGIGGEWSVVGFGGQEWSVFSGYSWYLEDMGG